MVDIGSVPTPSEPEAVASPPQTASERRTKYQKGVEKAESEMPEPDSPNGSRGKKKDNEEAHEEEFTDSDNEAGLGVGWIGVGVMFLKTMKACSHTNPHI